MLDYKKKEDGLDYGALLNAPPGYRFVRAVGTCYSLDLVALLSIPVALFHQRNLDDGVDEDHMDLLDALQDMASRVTVYCQKGNITAQRNPGKTLCFIEDCVREVLPADPRTSFHPKLWVLRFEKANGPALYRIVIGSRNLTFDRSWDVAYFLEGFVGPKAEPTSRPMVDMLQWLSDQKPFTGSTTFIADLGRVSFTAHAPFDRVGFHPSGSGTGQNPLQAASFKDLLVVSPFVDVTALRLLASQSTGQRWLLSRKEELDRIPLDVLAPFHTWAFSEDLVEGEYAEELAEEAGEDRLFQQLHAKLYIGELRSGGSQWYLGSANASQAALERNMELMVGLGSTERSMAPAAMATALLEREDGLRVFVPYEREQQDPLATEEYDYRRELHTLLAWSEAADSLAARCMPTKEHEKKFDVLLHFHDTFPVQPGITVTCAPFNFRGKEQSITPGAELVFEQMALFDLSPFLRWTVTKDGQPPKSFLTTMRIELPEGRKDEVFRSFFKDTEAFLRFIQFLLGVGDVDLFSAGNEQEASGRQHAGMAGFGAFPLLEQLFVAASRHPERLVSIDKAVQRLERVDGGSVIPKEFAAIWPRFKPFMHG